MTNRKLDDRSYAIVYVQRVQDRNRSAAFTCDDRQDPTRTSHTLRSNALRRMSRQLGAATSTSEMGRYLPANIPDSGRSDRLVQVCAEFQSIDLPNRFQRVYLDKPGVTTSGWGASLVRMSAHGPFPGLDVVA